ncbi:hypothetical protein [Streptomyces sp. NPDC102476]|uniref:hypothetical protein n=1 Tax=Streptomyces sp. NPDC102476 TaxID=3366181 RepID=UPI00381C5DDE
MSGDLRERPVWQRLGRFASARQTLAALGSLYCAGALDWSCHRDPDGAAYWLLSSLPGRSGAEVIALHGGRSRRLGGADVPKPGRGSPADDWPGHLDEVRSWRSVTAVELLAGLSTHGPPTPGHRLLHVLTAAQLSRTVVERAFAAGVTVSFVRADERPLFAQEFTGEDRGADRGAGGDDERMVLILGTPAAAHRPGRDDDTVPEPLVHFLTGLPRTSVCRPSAFCERLLLDVRLLVPAPEELLQAEVPEGELWVLGDAGEGPPLALRTRGAAAPLHIQPPDEPLRPAAGARRATPRHDQPPPRPTVRVVARHSASTRIDAALLTDDELGLLRRFLPGRPLGERGHFAPGHGRHLLLSPEDLAACLPFGVPLRRIGPGGCYVQSGHTLEPDLPPAARTRVLGLRPGRAVAYWQGGRCDFGLHRLVPLWTLWAPAEPPPVEPGMSEVARELLSAFETLTGRSTVPGAAPAQESDPGPALERAARLYAEGRLVEAAEAYRAAGSPLEAARLFEEAALNAPEDS